MKTGALSARNGNCIDENFLNKSHFSAVWYC
jgi:hypothetical protein